MILLQSLNLIFIITESKQRMMLRLNSTVVPSLCSYQHICSENGQRVFSRSATSNFGQSSMCSKRIYRFLHNKRRHWLHLSYHLSKSKPQRPRQAEWDQIDVERTAGIGSTSRLYLYNETNKSSPPKSTLQGYHIGAADNDQLRVRIHESDYHG